MKVDRLKKLRGFTPAGASRVFGLILGASVLSLLPQQAGADPAPVEASEVTVNPATTTPVIITLLGPTTDSAATTDYGLTLTYHDNVGTTPSVAALKLYRPVGQFSWVFSQSATDHSDRTAMQLNNDHSLTLIDRTNSSNTIVLNPSTTPGTGGVYWNGQRLATVSEISSGYVPLVNGNVGIGTPTPQYSLDVNGSTSTTRLYIPATTDANTGVIYQGGERFIHSLGTNSTFLGKDAGNLSATPANLIAQVGIGASALANIQSGENNIAIGSQALISLQSGSQNVAIGENALAWASNTNSNIAIGGTALQRVGTKGTQGDNIGIGISAGYSVDNIGNVYIGSAAGYAVPTGASYNTGVGTFSMNTNYFPPGVDSMVGGVDNVALGESSLGQIKTASMNTVIGATAGVYIQSGSSNTLLGWRAGQGIVTGQNNIIIGASADTDSSDPSYTLNIGGQIFGTAMNADAHIGIGTNAPQAKLDVNGDAAVRGVLRVPAAGDVDMGAFTSGTNPNPPAQ